MSAQSAGMAPPVENRAAPRFVAALVPSITGLRVSPHGTDATLVNISETGLLAECPVRLKVGGAVTMTFEGTFEPASVPARVIRCAVAAMGKGGSLLYHVALSFDSRIPLGTGAAPTSSKPEPMTAEAVPVHAVVRNRW